MPLIALLASSSASELAAQVGAESEAACVAQMVTGFVGQLGVAMGKVWGMVILIAVGVFTNLLMVRVMVRLWRPRPIHAMQPVVLSPVAHGRGPGMRLQVPMLAASSPQGEARAEARATFLEEDSAETGSGASAAAGQLMSLVVPARPQSRVLGVLVRPQLVRLVRSGQEWATAAISEDSHQDLWLVDWPDESGSAARGASQAEAADFDPARWAETRALEVAHLAPLATSSSSMARTRGSEGKARFGQVALDLPACMAPGALESGRPKEPDVVASAPGMVCEHATAGLPGHGSVSASKHEVAARWDAWPESPSAPLGVSELVAMWQLRAQSRVRPHLWSGSCSGSGQLLSEWGILSVTGEACDKDGDEATRAVVARPCSTSEAVPNDVPTAESTEEARRHYLQLGEQTAMSRQEVNEDDCQRRQEFSPGRGLTGAPTPVHEVRSVAFSVFNGHLRRQRQGRSNLHEGTGAWAASGEVDLCAAFHDAADCAERERARFERVNHDSSLDQFQQGGIPGIAGQGFEASRGLPHRPARGST